MKRLSMALILTCVLSVSALAGDIPTVGAPVAPPAPQSTSSNAATTILLIVLNLIR